MRKRLIYISLTILLATSVSSFAQNALNAGNLQNINVDDLSDAQITKFVEKAEQSGYSQQQLELLAKARGMSPTQISKLNQRINKLKLSSGGSSSKEISRLRGNPDVLGDKETAFDPFKDIFPADTVKKEKLPIFGMSFFQNSNLTFEPSLSIPTPTNYAVGPGDQIIIDVWGASEQTYQLTISPEGSVVIPNIGPVYLNGLTIEKAETKLKSKLKSIYSTLGDNTFAQVSLGQIRTISVNVVGEVKIPGTYQLSSFATAFNALYTAGGPSKNGSLRQIFVFRQGKKIGQLDAYKFLIDGEGENVQLQDQDVLLVKPYISRVAIEGEVKRPAYYEIIDESLADVVAYAGGFSSEAYTKSISLERNDENSKTVKTVNSDEFGSLILKNGDRIYVGVISNQFKNRVRIEGAVNHPGEFELTEKMMLTELVDLADGLRGDAFLEQALIIRENKDLTLSNIAFKPSELIAGGFDIELQNGDLVKLQSIFDLREQYKLTLQGEVIKPGTFPFVEGMTVENLIYLAGGFKESAAKSFVEVARRVVDDSQGENISSEIYNFPISETLDLTSEASEFQLKPFDLVVIRKSPFYENQAVVEIEGEVQFPGKYVIQNKNERISDVLKRAGNVTDYAYVKGAILIRRTEYYASADGESKIATKIRREELQELFERDTIGGEKKRTFKTQESIGIQLDEILKNPGSAFDLILKEGDVISIPREFQTVRVRGQVLYPSTIRYDKSYSFTKLVSQAGGFSDNALKRKSYIIYANGTAQKTNSFLWFKHYPAIEPGAELIIPTKREKRRLTPGEIVGLSSGLTTMAWVVFQIINSK